MWWVLPVAIILALLLVAPVHGQDDPCEACIKDWSAAEYPCLPLTEEPWGIVYLPAIMRGP